MTYFLSRVNQVDKPLVWMHGAVKTPPFSNKARIEAGILLRLLQRGESIEMPRSRTMPAIGSRCHELRIKDANVNWRIIYRVDAEAIVLLEVFAKKTSKTPNRIINLCKQRIREYDSE